MPVDELALKDRSVEAFGFSPTTEMYTLIGEPRVIEKLPAVAPTFR